MNKNILIGFLIVSILLSGCTAPKTETQPTGGIPASTTNAEQKQTTTTAFSVEIKSFAFNPETITISRGSTVTWTQFDTVPHTIKSVGSDVINSPSLSKGQTYSHTFNEAGTFEYYCSIHPSMKGKIIVN